MRRRATPRRLARLARSGLRARGAPILQRRKCARLCARARTPPGGSAAAASPPTAVFGGPNSHLAFLRVPLPSAPLPSSRLSPLSAHTYTITMQEPTATQRTQRATINYWTVTNTSDFTSLAAILSLRLLQACRRTEMKKSRGGGGGKGRRRAWLWRPDRATDTSQP